MTEQQIQRDNDFRIANWEQVINSESFKQNPAQCLRYLYDAVDAYASVGSRNSAIHAIDTAVSLCKGKLSLERICDLSRMKTNLFLETGNLRYALDESTRAIKTMQSSVNYETRALVLSNIAEVAAQATEEIVTLDSELDEEDCLDEKLSETEYKSGVAQKIGNYKLAIRDIQKAIELSKNPNAEHHLFISNCYIGAGDLKNARTHLERAMHIDGKSGTYAQDIRELWQILMEDEEEAFSNQSTDQTPKYQSMPKPSKPNLN